MTKQDIPSNLNISFYSKLPWRDGFQWPTLEFSSEDYSACTTAQVIYASMWRMGEPEIPPSMNASIVFLLYHVMIIFPCLLWNLSLKITEGPMGSTADIAYVV